MPKDVLLQPNLRVDIPDFEAKTSGYTRESDKLILERAILDNRCALIEGFRVEIADQGSSPGLFTIVNGVAFNRAGQIVTNENDVVATRSTTLSINGTYFVEIEYITEESDTANRAFWDPRFNNGSDPSGDPRPFGREFTQSTATRITPDWRIVTPISTSGFELTTNPNSLRIPVATITMAGGVITGGTTSPLTSVLIEGVPALSGTLKLLDTRAMPNTFTLTVNPGGGTQEDVSVASNDRENGILTLSGTTVNLHNEGERVIVGGVTPAEYLVQRSDPALPTSGTEDARPRIFQADEERGALLALDPDGSGLAAESDLSVTNLKRYVDFIASQLRQLKFGYNSEQEKGQVGPPNSGDFTNQRYYMNAGSVLGARAHSVSVGDGVNSWGDFNASEYPSDEDAIQAAVAALQSQGGTVFIKTGNYTINAPIAFSMKSITFVGECVTGGSFGTNLIANAAPGPNSEIFAISGDPNNVHWENLTMTKNGLQNDAIIISGPGTYSARNCNIAGMASTALITRGYFENCNFVDGNDAVGGSWNNTTFQSCKLQTTSSGDSACLDLDALNNNNVVFRNCEFTYTTGQTPNSLVKIGSSVSNLSFEKCTFGGLGLVTFPAILTMSGGGAPSGLIIRECTSSVGGGLIQFQDGYTNVLIENCSTSGSSTACITFFATATYTDFIIRNCVINHNNGLFVPTNNCVFTRFLLDKLQISSNTVGIDFDGNNTITDITVSNCTLPSLGTTTYGCFRCDGGTRVKLLNNYFEYGHSGFGYKSTLSGGGRPINGLEISGNTFRQFATNAAQEAIAIDLTCDSAAPADKVNIHHNDFYNTDVGIHGGVSAGAGVSNTNICYNNFANEVDLTTGRVGMRFLGNTNYGNMNIIGNTFTTLRAPTNTHTYGIAFDPGGLGAFLGNVRIAENSFSSIGQSANQTRSVAIWISIGVSSTNVQVDNNNITSVNASSESGGIVLNSTVDTAVYTRCSVTGNDVINIGIAGSIDGFAGIVVRRATACTIANNRFSATGTTNSTNPGVVFANAAIQVGFAGSATQNDHNNINGNSISSVNGPLSPDDSYGIRVYGATNSNICNNTIKVAEENSARGIRIDSTGVTNSISFLNINSNVIKGPVDDGIAVNLSHTTAETDVAININNNIIHGFADNGIGLDTSGSPPAGPQAAPGPASTFVISGNSMFTDRFSVDAIQLSDVQGVVVSNNSIRTIGTGTDIGVLLLNCDRVVICGNMVVTNSPTTGSACIDTGTGSLNVLVAGNMVGYNWVADGFGGSKGIRIDDYTFAASNYIHHRGAYNANIYDNNVAGEGHTRARAISTGNVTVDAGQVPASLSDVGLNWHVVPIP